MGLLASNLKAIAPVLKGARVLSLGYPDIMVPPAEVKALLGVDPAPPHPATGHPETVETLRRAGVVELVICDLAKIRGPEVVLDLNDPQAMLALPAQDYDLVLDAGTLEHCFCPGTALLNMASMVKPGGRIYHTPPMTMMNHGFYNLCPTLFADFYQQNGWQVWIAGYTKKGRGEPFTVEFTARFKHTEPESVLHVWAKRPEGAPEPIELRRPMQTKYMSPR